MGLFVSYIPKLHYQTAITIFRSNFHFQNVAEEELKTETQPEPEPNEVAEPVEEKPFEEEPAEEKPKPKPKKKVVKKIKKDVDDDYIQKLINMEIPKTELEVFEKLEFEEPKKKPKRKSLVPSTSVEQEAPELIVEELPEETVTVQLPPNEQGDVVEQKVTKRKFKKKQGDQEQIIEIVTVEEEGKEPETEVTIEEPQPAKPVEEIQPDEDIQPAEDVQPTLAEIEPAEEVQPVEEIEPVQPKTEQTKPKKKKVKKPKSNEEDEYIRKLIEQDIPKTELEQFEKPEFEEPVKKPKKKHSLVSRTSTEEESITESVTEDIQDENIQVKLPKKVVIDEEPIPEDEVFVQQKKRNK